MDMLASFTGEERLGIGKVSLSSTIISLTKEVLSKYIEGMEANEEYDMDDYVLFDEWLSANPCVYVGDGKEYSSLAELVPVIVRYWDLDLTFSIDCWCVMDLGENYLVSAEEFEEKHKKGEPCKSGDLM